MVINNMGMLIHDDGMLTTIQDLGRYGFQAEGMVVAGAMDAYALQIGNLLVGNHPDAPAIEITILGPTIEATTDLIITLTGADLSPTIDGQPIPCWQPILFECGSILRFQGSRSNGGRSYLAVHGTWALSPFYESYSTYLMGKIGGWEGRPLQKGDQLTIIRTPLSAKHLLRRRLSPSLIPTYPRKKRLRVMWGIHREAFTPEGLQTFLTHTYQITPRFNRMGMRLTGEPIEHHHTADVISTTVTFGTIQVPANGQPIILLADRQTTGGYTQIANVISVDLPLLAQSLPGDRLTFQLVTMEEAQKECIAVQRIIKQLWHHNRFEFTT